MSPGRQCAVAVGVLLWMRALPTLVWEGPVKALEETVCRVVSLHTDGLVPAISLARPILMWTVKVLASYLTLWLYLMRTRPRGRWENLQSLWRGVVHHVALTVLWGLYAGACWMSWLVANVPHFLPAFLTIVAVWGGSAYVVTYVFPAARSRVLNPSIVWLQEKLKELQVSYRTNHNLHLVAMDCAICRKGIVDTVNIPCGHSFLCQSCQATFRATNGNVCNACRKPCTFTQVVHAPSCGLGLTLLRWLTWRIYWLTRRLLRDTPRPPSLLRIPSRGEFADFHLAESPGSPASNNPLRLVRSIVKAGLKRTESNLRHSMTLCRHCEARRADTVHLPCGHSSLCKLCAKECNQRKCPVCRKAGVAEALVFNQRCSICLEDVWAPFIVAMGVCGHLLCVACTVRYVRGALGAVAEEVKAEGLRCPHHPSGCTDHLRIATVYTLVEAPTACSTVSGAESDQIEVNPLTKAESLRLERFVVEAGIPMERRLWCVNERCARLLDIHFDQFCEDPHITCPYCNTDICVQCKIRWHAAVSCAEVQEMRNDCNDGSGTTTYDLIHATTKGCPRCGFRISHYHGHACHHIMPGSGCLNCGEHFCYKCCKPYRRFMRTVSSQCKCELFCKNSDIKSYLVRTPFPYDKRCGCCICPDCRPGRPCSLCDGTCVVCRSTVPPGEMVATDGNSSKKVVKWWMAVLGLDRR